MKNSKFKKKTSTFIGITLSLICFFCGYFLKTFNQKVTPKIIEIANKNIEKVTYNLFNDYTLLASLDEDLLNNLLVLNKNNNNEIIHVNYNMKAAYQIINQIAGILHKDYQKLEDGTKKIAYYDELLNIHSDGLIMSIPIGAASNSVYLTNLGPKIPIKMKFIGTMLTNLKTRIKNYGINNALIEIYVDVYLTNEIVTPVTYQNNELQYEILLSAQIINGEVPAYYGNLYETKSNILNVPIE